MCHVLWGPSGPSELNRGGGRHHREKERPPPTSTPPTRLLADLQSVGTQLGWYRTEWNRMGSEWDGVPRLRLCFLPSLTLSRSECHPCWESGLLIQNWQVCSFFLDATQWFSWKQTSLSVYCVTIALAIVTDVPPLQWFTNHDGSAWDASALWCSLWLKPKRSQFCSFVLFSVQQAWNEIMGPVWVYVCVRELGICGEVSHRPYAVLCCLHLTLSN